MRGEVDRKRGGEMNERELKEAREICEAATVGEWKPCLGSGLHVCTGIHAYSEGKFIFIADVLPDYVFKDKMLTSADHRDNLKFICFARTALPKALDEIEELHTQKKIMLEALTKLSKLGNGENWGNSVGNIIAQKALSEVQDNLIQQTYKGDKTK